MPVEQGMQHIDEETRQLPTAFQGLGTESYAYSRGIDFDLKIKCVAGGCKVPNATLNHQKLKNSRKIEICFQDRKGSKYGGDRQ